MVDRAPKPCLHKRANHQHGTYASYIQDRCRCLRCAYAASVYELARKKRNAYGRSNLVDAEPARQRVRELMAAGVGLKRIVKASGVPQGSLWKLMYGKNGGPPSRRVTRSTAERLLALDPANPGLLADGAKIHPAGTARRIKALATLGWSVNRLAAEGGMDRQVLDQALHGKDVTAGTARAVAALYERLWDQPAPGRDHRERISVSRTINRAKASQWAPPLAWDDEMIDDPEARPNKGVALRQREGTAFDEVAVQRAMHGDKVALRPVERAEVVHRLTAQGLTAAQIAARVRVDERSVQRIRDDRRRAGEVA